MNKINQHLHPHGTRKRLLTICLLASMGLHLVVFLLLLYSPTKVESDRGQRTIVRLVEAPKIRKMQKSPPEAKQPDYEIDQIPQPAEAEKPVESPRKAIRDQRVEQEQAPPGDDVRDQFITPAPRPESAATKPAPPPPAKASNQAPAGNTTAVQENKLRQAEADIAIRKETSEPAERNITAKDVAPPVLSRDQLFPDPGTLGRIAAGSQGERERIKERQDVAIGDTIWLNLQHDLLVSFFRRFHDQVERVWNYPADALRAGLEGTLELMITVSKEGELLDVDLRRGSGSDILDFEAIQAVYRAAPFGPMTRHYPHEQLHIRAHFSYRIIGRSIYGLP